PPLTERQFVSPIGIEDMPAVERRRSIVETGIAVGEPLVRSVLSSTVQQVAERVRPDIVGAERQSRPVLLLEINLERVVVVVAVRILVVHVVQERVGAEEVERVFASRRETNAG